METAEQDVFRPLRLMEESEDGDEDEDCLPSGVRAFPADFLSQDQRMRGGVTLHFLIAAYACAATALVCERHFVPALEVIAERLRLSPDVAGATFMAMGASAPELFSSVAGAFLTENDIGLGTVLGSAVFNMLAVTGIVGLMTGNQPVSVDWYPVVRDSLVYGLTVVVLGCILLDNVVEWWEALILLTLFASYVILMHYNAGIEAAVKGCVVSGRGNKKKDPEKDPLLEEKIQVVPDAHAAAERSLHPGETASAGCPAGRCCRMSVCVGVVWRWAMSPASLLFRLTVPGLRWYPVTFVASVAWMGALSYITVWMVTLIGFTFSIPDSVSGLTLLAVGSSVPDLIATVLVANSGEGNMAISNLLGSNTFDVCFCLGGPWFLKSAVSAGGRLPVYSRAMLYTVSTLLCTLGALLLTFRCTGWTLNRTAGIACLMLYALAIGLACLYELGLNKPVCSL